MSYLEAHVLVQGVGYGCAASVLQPIPGQVEVVQGHIVHQALRQILGPQGLHSTHKMSSVSRNTTCMHDQVPDGCCCLLKPSSLGTRDLDAIDTL